jgi:hypothetical protein
MKTIYERLEQIYPLIIDPRFRQHKGLGNETELTHETLY